MLTKYLNYSSWAAVYQNISFGFSFGLSWAQWFLLIGLMDYCDQIFLFFLIPCHPLIVTISNDSYDTIILVTWLQGHICGLGAMSGLPHLLVFDITKCLNPGVMFSGCDTPQVRNERKMFNLTIPKLVEEIMFWIPWKAKRLGVSVWQNIE